MRRSISALSLLLAACPAPSQPVPRDSPARTREPAVEVAADGPAAPAGRDAPVYGEPVPELPEARQLCDALHLLPAARSGVCCAGGGAGEQAQELADRCTQALSSAVAGGGLVLRDEALAACISGLEAAYTSCEWVGSSDPPLPAGCLEVTHGTLPAAARCRSSRECAPGLRCADVGPAAPGVCAPAAEDGAPCDTAGDPLASLLRDVDLAAHSACRGRCVQGRCRAALAAGAACGSGRECAAGLHCDGEVCVAGASAAAGQPCADGGCVDGTRCVQGMCVAPAPTGAACETDRECRGACLKGTDGRSRCGPRC